MNVTLGVPRIQEVMNATKVVKTPYVDAKLLNDHDEIAARVVKGQLDRVSLGQIARKMELIQSSVGCYIEIILDVKLISDAKLPITPASVRDSILGVRKIGVKADNIGILGSDTLQISFRSLDPSAHSFVLQQLLLKLPKLPVSGLEGISRVLISTDTDKGGNKVYRLFVEGNALLNVMTSNGIDWKSTVANDVAEVERVLGIEAARSVIISEINAVYQSYSLSLDKRHLALLGDVMTLKGKIHGMNRHGLAKTSTSSLKLASFEVTMEHLFNAGFYHVEDDASGASSSVILGSFAKIGSGMTEILVARDVINGPVLTPGKFLTPQNPSVMRELIETGKFEVTE
jgi:DNA-directed RNA polymerase III subunit RPC1